MPDQRVVVRLEELAMQVSSLLEKYKEDEVNDHALSKGLDNIIKEVSFARNARAYSYPTLDNENSETTITKE